MWYIRIRTFRCTWLHDDTRTGLVIHTRYDCSTVDQLMSTIAIAVAIVSISTKYKYKQKHKHKHRHEYSMKMNMDVLLAEEGSRYFTEVYIVILSIVLHRHEAHSERLRRYSS